MSSGVPFRRSRERLLPLEDVAALDSLGRRVVKRDLARQVHAERDELVAGPADVADGLARAAAHHLPELEHVAAPIEPIGRPGERRQPADSCRTSATSTLTWTKRRPSRRDRLTRVTLGAGRLRTARAPGRDRAARAGSTVRSAPRSATSAGTDALTFSVAEPSSARYSSSSYSYCVFSDAAAARRSTARRATTSSTSARRGAARRA